MSDNNKESPAIGEVPVVSSSFTTSKVGDSKECKKEKEQELEKSTSIFEYIFFQHRELSIMD